MVSSIGSAASSLFSQYQEMMSSSETYSTKQGQSFDELVGSGKISTGEEASSGSGITSMGSCSDSSSSNSEMDLNGDGTVTIDEIMQYTAMQMMEQMMEQMKEQMAAEEGSEQMGQQSGQDTQQQKFDMNNFKTQMAAQAYQMGENLLSASISSVTQSFAL